MAECAATHELRILGAAGDTRLTWDVNDPASREKARAEIARMKAAGYLFFLVDGTPARPRPGLVAHGCSLHRAGAGPYTAEARR